jgi:redox-sensitive bicupin YhaK (pirin superfamily)
MTGSVTVIPQKTNFTMGEAIVFGMDGNTVKLVSGESGARFIFLAGRPLREPVHWYGPIVMNSQEQLNEAFRDLQNGTFIRDREPLFL